MIFQRNILVLLRQSKMNVTNRICNQPVNWLSDSTAPPDDKGLIRSTEIGSFAKAFEKFSALQTKQENFEEKKIAKSFLTLLRESKFMQMGDPKGKVIEGRIYHIVEDDLYVDFGGKFPAVCQRPTKDAELFVRGAVMRLRLFELELSTRFLGSATDMTLLEADAKSLGIIYSPARPSTRTSTF